MESYYKNTKKSMVRSDGAYQFFINQYFIHNNDSEISVTSYKTLVYCISIISNTFLMLHVGLLTIIELN